MFRPWRQIEYATFIFGPIFHCPASYYDMMKDIVHKTCQERKKNSNYWRDDLHLPNNPQWPYMAANFVQGKTA